MDDDGMRLLIGRALRESGCRVTGCRNGPGATGKGAMRMLPLLVPFAVLAVGIGYALAMDLYGDT